MDGRGGTRHGACEGIDVPSSSERSRAGTLSLLLALGPGACNEPEENACQVERVSSAIVRGYARTEYLGLSESDASAIVALQFERTGGGRDLCSGVVVANGALLTAAHCFDDETLTIGIGRALWHNAGAGAFSVEVSPLHDVALVRLPGMSSIASLAWSAEEFSTVRGGFVELAGAGLTESGLAGAPEFAVAEVLSVDARYVDVRLTQAGGPCGGDSGGPLLVRAASGHVEVAGVLSKGNPDCHGPDRYERLDGLDSWLRERIDPSRAGSDACGNVTERGRCFGRRAVWCDAGRVRAQDCRDGASCGWSDSNSAFRCVPLGSDPCGGTPDTGACINGAAVRCVEGELERLRCADCGGSCQISARSGSATCALAAD